MVTPVTGLMMGMGFRARVAEGWWSFSADCWLWYPGGMKGGDAECRAKADATWVGCCVGEPCGELLASDDRSEDELFIDTSCRRGKVSPENVPADPSPPTAMRLAAHTKATHIALGQQSGAELHVVFQVERSTELEPGPKSGNVCRFGKLLHAPDAPKLLLGVLRDR